MSLIVEDGSIVAGANSYASVADADAYFADRANAAWAALTTPQKQAALIQAGDYLEATYATAWKGDRVSADQPMSWPRVGVIAYGYELPADGVPETLQRANIELAVRASSGPLAKDEGQRVKRRKVDVLETEYSEYSSAQTTYTAVSRMLAAYLKSDPTASGIRSVPLVRA